MSPRVRAVLPASLLLGDVALGFAIPLLEGPLANPLMPLIAHAGLAGGYAFSMRALVLGAGQGSSWHFTALAGLLAFFVPVLGGVAFLAAILTLVYTRRKTEIMPFERFGLPSALELAVPQQLRPRMVHDRLVHLVRGGKQLDTRFKAVLATTHAPAVVAVPVLKAALADVAEEVRLSAFAQLERTRRGIEQRIERRREALKEETLTPERKAAVHATLAQDYFEIAYLGLAEGEVYKHTLRAAEEQTRLALGCTPGVAALLHLLARLDMRQGRLPEARANLEAALLAGLPSGELASDRAEVAFCERKWDEVASLLAELALVKHDHVVLARVQEFWRWR